MSEYERLKNELKALSEKKDFAKAAATGAKIMQDFADLADKWVLWYIARAYQKTKQFEDALSICRKAYPMDRSFEPVRQTYAWVIFQHVIKNPHEHKRDDLQKAANAVFQLSPPGNPYSPAPQTAIQMAKHCGSENHWDDALRWLKRISLDHLTDRAAEFKTKEGKTVRIASDKEQFFAILTKTLLALQKWDELIDACDVGLQSVKKFHYGNNIWFRWRKFNALFHLGKTEEATALIRLLRKKKPAWFFTAAEAELEWKKNQNPQAALRLFAQAMIEQGDLEKKVKVLIKMAGLLEKNKQIPQLKAHLRLIRWIYEKEGWMVPPQLQLLLDTHPAEADFSKKDEMPSMREFWEQTAYSGQPEMTGVISKVLKHGRSGFIRAADGNSYFVSVHDFLSPSGAFVEGTKVRFRLKDGFDKKKGVPAKNAFRVKAV